MTIRVRLRGKTDHSPDLFGFGRYSKENRDFLRQNDGQEFDVVRHNMNYYRLPNNYLVHIYETR